MKFFVAQNFFFPRRFKEDICWIGRKLECHWSPSDVRKIYSHVAQSQNKWWLILSLSIFSPLRSSTCISPESIKNKGICWRYSYFIRSYSESFYIDRSVYFRMFQEHPNFNLYKNTKYSRTHAHTDRQYVTSIRLSIHSSISWTVQDKKRSPYICRVNLPTLPSTTSSKCQQKCANQVPS